MKSDAQVPFGSQSSFFSIREVLAVYYHDYNFGKILFDSI